MEFKLPIYIRKNPWLAGGIGIVACAALSQAFRSSTTSVVAAPAERISVSAGTTKSIDSPPGLADAAAETSDLPPGLADDAQQSGVMRVLVLAQCKESGKKTLVSCQGISLRNGPTGAPGRIFATNGIAVRVVGSVGEFSQIELLSDSGTGTGRIGWIDDRWLVSGT